MKTPPWQDITCRDIRWQLDALPDVIAPLETDCAALLERIVDLTIERDAYALLARSALAHASTLTQRNVRLLEQIQTRRDRPVIAA